MPRVLSHLSWYLLCVVFTSVVFIVTCIAVLFDLATFLSLTIADYAFAIDQKYIYRVIVTTTITY